MSLPQFHESPQQYLLNKNFTNPIHLNSQHIDKVFREQNDSSPLVKIKTGSDKEGGE